MFWGDERKNTPGFDGCKKQSTRYYRALPRPLRLDAQEAAEALASRFKLGQAARLLQAARIRWVYFQLMDLCTELGRPRPAAVTPLEFLPDLEALFPDSQAGLGFITQAYLKVRYGELPESRDEVEQVVSAWKKVETQGKQQKAALKKAR